MCPEWKRPRSPIRCRPTGQGDADTFGIEGQTLPAGEMNPIISEPTVGPDFFRTLGIPLVKGRYFTGHDNQSSGPVAIVSEGLVRRFFPNSKPLASASSRAGRVWRQVDGDRLV